MIGVAMFQFHTLLTDAVLQLNILFSAVMMQLKILHSGFATFNCLAQCLKATGTDQAQCY